MSEVKYCKDCKFYLKGFTSNWCDRLPGTVSVVTGKTEKTYKDYLRAESERKFLSEKTCGPEAKYFQPKWFGRFIAFLTAWRKS